MTVIDRNAERRKKTRFVLAFRRDLLGRPVFAVVDTKYGLQVYESRKIEDADFVRCHATDLSRIDGLEA